MKSILIAYFTRFTLIFNIIVICFLISSCSDKNKEGIYIMFEQDLQLILFDNGREIDRKILTLDTKEKEIMTTWAKSFSNVKNKDYNSYTPVTILRGKKFNVNFQKNKTVISFKRGDNPEDPWEQYARLPTELDKKIKDFLERDTKSHY